MRNIQFVNDILEIDVDGRSFVIPTNDNTKLKKYNEFTLDGNKTGYIDETLEPDDDPDTGLLWMAYPILYFADDTKKEITTYLFSERPRNIIIKDNLVSVEVNANGLVYKDVTRWANQTKDSDADDRPDVYDSSIEGSLAWLYSSTEFNYNWQIKYSLANSVIPNDFGIAEADIDIFPFGISGGNRLYDSGGNILTKEKSVTVDGGTVDIYNVKGFTEVRENDKPGNNYGDCKVYDGVTPVTDPAHVFTGNAKFTNDDITIEISVTKVYFYSKDYAKSEDTYIDSAGPAFTINSINPDKIVFVLDGNTCYLSRGLPYVQMVISSGQPYLHTINRFVHFSDGSLYDGAFESAGTVTPATDVQYGAATDTANDVVFLVAIATGTVSATAAGGSDFSDLKCSVGETWQSIGALPINPIYIEDTELTLRSGSSLETDAGAYDNSVVRITKIEGGVEFPHAKTNLLSPGGYTVFTRVKSIDTTRLRFFWFADIGGMYDMIEQSVVADGNYHYVAWNITIPVGVSISRMFADCYDSANGALIDYTLVTNIEKIQQAAESSMVKTETTKEVIKVNR